MNKMGGWFGGNDVLTDPETQSDRSSGGGSPNDGSNNIADNANNTNSAGTNTESTTAHLQASLTSANTQIATFQNRLSSLERRIRERDAQLTACKEEKGRMGMVVTDLKNQLYQLQFDIEETSADKADSIQSYESKLLDAKREMDEMKRALDEATGRQVELEEQLGNGSNTNVNEEGEKKYQALLKRCQELEQLNSKLQSDSNNRNNTTSSSSLQQQLDSTILELTNTKSHSTKEISNLRSMLRARDDAIQSLQCRLEKSSGDMTLLEAELDSLREMKLQEHKREDEKVGEVGNLWRLNDEMAKIIEGQSKKMDDLNQRLEEKKLDYEQQLASLEKRREGEVQDLKLKLEGVEMQVLEMGEELLAKDGLVKQLRDELEAERSAVASSSVERDTSHHSRVASLECQLEERKEREDELTQSLNEALEEVEDLQADIVFKDGKLAALERELDEAGTLLEGYARGDAPQSLPCKESGNFARLRKEIEKVTRERAQLESQHSRQLAQVEQAKREEIAALERKLEEVSDALSTVRVQLNEKTAKVTDLSTELDETRGELNLIDAESDEELQECKLRIDLLQDEKAELKSEIQELYRKISSLEEGYSDDAELREAQQALIAMDTKHYQSIKEKEERMQSLSVELANCEERILVGESRLNKEIRERELVIGDLRKELDAKETRSKGMSIDPDCDDDDTGALSKLKVQASTLEKEKNMIETELRAKLEARDATIATLVLTSSNQEEKIVSLRSEVGHLKVMLDNKKLSELAMSQQLKGHRGKEMDVLRNRLQEMSKELTQTKRKLASVTQQLECANDQISTTESTQDVQDLAGRLAVSEQAQRMIKKDNDEKLKERDSAISNLLHSIQANETIISNLRLEVDGFKRKLNHSLEENRRLQHESEIFAAQIIDQDEEFEGLNAQLQEKTAEIGSLKKEIASSKVDARKVAKLQVQLDEAEREKQHSADRVKVLERRLDEAESKNVEKVGFEVERLQLELKNAVADKVLTEEKLTKQIDSLRKLRNHAVEDFEAKLRQRDRQITVLETELLELREKVSDNTVFDVDLDGNAGPTKEQLTELSDKCVELGDERDMLKRKIVVLAEEIESLKASSESQQLSELRSQLEQSEAMREALEESMINSNKDKEIDRLHKQLAEAKEKQSASEMEQLARMKMFERENNQLKDEFSIRMKEKNAKIMALEQTLSAQEQVVGNMSSEMDQLQNGMEKISVQRRAEIEEMQQELMDYTTKATRLEREVVSLSMKLDDKKLKHRDEVAKLKERIANLESEPSDRGHHHNEEEDERIKTRLQEKVDHMKWLNSSLKDENVRLQNKLEALVATKAEDVSASAKSNDKWRTVALQEQVAVLSQRVIELEESSSGQLRTSGSSRSILESL
eukprot:g5791.t1 g5791   contig20:167848-172306(-)